MNVGQNTSLTADTPEEPTNRLLAANAASGYLSYAGGQTRTFLASGGTNPH